MNSRPHGAGGVRRGPFPVLLVAVFVVSLGYGVVLPVLPLIVERLTGSSDSAFIGRHTAFLAGVFAATPLLAAYPWGRLSDRFGRRPILVASLAGFALTLAASATAGSLWLLYLGRLLNGGFAAAVFPVTLAFIADGETDERRRARRFSWVGMTAILGFFVGPMLGGIVAGRGSRALGGAIFFTSNTLPFLVAAGLAAVAAVAVRWLLPGGPPPARPPQHQRQGLPAGVVRLLLLAAATAAGVSTFEVGLTLRSRELAMTPEALGLMFASCSLVMLVAQGIIFSPLIKPATTRWFIAPAFAAMAGGLALAPLAPGFDTLLVSVGAVAASAGLIAPVLAYWVSLAAGGRHGVTLGLQTVATSFGQTLGSVGAGLLFGLEGMPGAAFMLAAAVMLAGAVASLRLPALLASAGGDQIQPGTAREMSA